MTEIAGVEELGLISRGEDAEITTYLENGITSELSGNVIDLCPVGALTSKPFAFTARPWEMSKTETVDVMDAVGSNIRVDSRSGEVMRIMPRNNDGVNEEWISDKTRFIWDGLRVRRLDRPYIREDETFREAGWQEALDLVAKKMSGIVPRKAAMLVGDLVSAEEIYALKMLADTLEWKNIDCRQNGTAEDSALGRGSYLFNSTIEGIDKADAILLIGANPRLEAPVINARIRGRWARGKVEVGVIGANHDLTYKSHYIGASAESLSQLNDQSQEFSRILANAQYPMIIIGEAALKGDAGQANLIAAARLAKDINALRSDWNGFNVLHTAASRVAGLDIGFTPCENSHAATEVLKQAKLGQMDFIYLLGADEIDTDALGDTFVVYQGSHGDKGAARANVIFPGCAYTEKSGTYLNLEGRAQQTLRAVFPPNEAKEDWAIIRALSGALSKPLPFSSLTELRAALYKAHPHMAGIDEIKPAGTGDLEQLAQQQAAALSNTPLAPGMENFYLTNPIARASKVMNEMSEIKYGQNQRATGTK